MAPRFEELIGHDYRSLGQPGIIQPRDAVRIRKGRLFNAKSAARALGLSEWWISMAKRAGLKFDCGNKVYLDTVREWVAGNPHFRPADWQDKRFALGKRLSKTTATPDV